jgi:hypothetical protein
MCQQFFENKSIRNKASCVTAVVHNLASLQIHALISLTGDLLVKIEDLIYSCLEGALVRNQIMPFSGYHCYACINVW